MSRQLHIFLVVLWVLEVSAVVVGSLLPGSMMPQHLPNDKLLHFGGYFVAAALAAFAFERKLHAVLAGLALVGLGVALEFAQRLSPGRSFEVADMKANALGVAVGLLAGIAIRALATVWSGPPSGGPPAPDSLS